MWPAVRLCLTPTGPLRRALAGIVLAGCAAASLATPGVRLPAAVDALAGGLAPRGQAELRWFGLKLYDAALWTAGPYWMADGPHALEIRYARDIRGSRLVDTSIDEIRRLGHDDERRLGQWRSALAAVLPDVSAGDTLVGLHLPGRGAHFWHGEQPLGAITDPALAQAFFAIWLDARSREPALRAQLLGAAPPAR